MPQDSEMSQVEETSGGSRHDIIETNNFRHVLEFFNEEGNLKDNNTRVEIRCGICLEKNLSIMNSSTDTHSSEQHEPYTVLPRCGHGFGYRCVTKWLSTSGFRGGGHMRCPTCRERVFCDSNPLHFETPEIFHGYDSVRQRDDVNAIRRILSSAHRCGQCDGTASVASSPEEQLPGLPLDGTTDRAADMDGRRPEGALTRSVSELAEDITFAAAWVVEHIDDGWEHTPQLLEFLSSTVLEILNRGTSRP
ncbi:hypothetical protein DL769_011479 [Monosporascus sp. CRB-8-3]|nr:hypothetical protein DL769_011479 [Monosporascus sp. CRB-8-3]